MLINYPEMLPVELNVIESNVFELLAELPVARHYEHSFADGFHVNVL